MKRSAIVFAEFTINSFVLHQLLTLTNACRVKFTTVPGTFRYQFGYVISISLNKSPQSSLRYLIVHLQLRSTVVGIGLLPVDILLLCQLFTLLPRRILR